MKQQKLSKPNLTTLFLRVGLALTLGYAAVATLMSPDEWSGYLPPFWDSYSSALFFLKMVALFQLFLAAWLLSGLYVRLAATLCTITFACILLSNLGIMSITFRDVGLIFASVALAVSPEPKPAK